LSVRAIVVGGTLASAMLLAVPKALGSEPSAADRETSRALYAQGMQALDAHDTWRRSARAAESSSS
jgi:hypothetical protein